MLLSIVVLTYNHEQYLHQTLDSIFSQKIDFDFEVLICDDCSPDSTSDIVLAFKNKISLPNTIRYFRHDSNIGIKANGIFALSECKGKYIAMCEGDDYWTDEYKLQKQISFLENNLNVSVCFHDFLILQNGQFKKSKYNSKNQEPVNISNFYFNSYSDSPYWVTQTLTAVFRKCNIELEIYRKYKYFRDYHLYYHLLKKGKGYYFSDIMGVYRNSSLGEFTKLNVASKLKIDLEIKKEIYLFNNDKLYKRYYEGASALYLLFLLKEFSNNKRLILTFLAEVKSVSTNSLILVIIRTFYYILKKLIFLKTPN